MAYATTAQFRALMVQIPESEVEDDLIDDLLDRASSYLDLMIGRSYATPASGTVTVWGDATDYLALPAFTANSVTSVTAPAGYTVPDYVEYGGGLVTTSAAGLVYPAYRIGMYSGGWGYGIPYTVAATYGVAVPDILVEATLEVAVDMWHGKDSSFSGVVGVDGEGAVVRSKNQRVIDVIKALRSNATAPLRIA